MNCLSEKETWKKLDHFEVDSGILHLEVSGWPVWQILRFAIASKMQNLNWQKPSISRWELITALVRGLSFWKIRRRDYIVHSLYSGARIISEKSYTDIWFEDLLENVPGGGKFIRYNTPGYSKRQSKLRTPYDYDTTLLIYFATFLAKIFPVNDPYKTSRKIAELASEKLSLPFLTESFILRRVSVIHWQKVLYKQLLRVIKPRAVLVIDTTEFSLLSASKDLGIKFIELQHGIFTRFHPRSLRPEESCSKLLFPTTLGLYGDFWRNELQLTAAGEMNLLTVIGNPLLEKFRKLREGKSKSSKPVFLVTTQPFDLTSMRDFFREFLSLCQNDLKIIFKLHPASGSASGLLHELKDPRVEILTGLQEPSTYDLIANADVHLSVASACHYDSLAIGTPTIVLALEGHELMLNLFEQGVASLVKTPSELLRFIEEGMTVSVNPDVFCKPGFCETMKKLI